jgi:hypothetical protein
LIKGLSFYCKEKKLKLFIIVYDPLLFVFCLLKYNSSHVVFVPVPLPLPVPVPVLVLVFVLVFVLVLVLVLVPSCPCTLILCGFKFESEGMEWN